MSIKDVRSRLDREYIYILDDRSSPGSESMSNLNHRHRLGMEQYLFRMTTVGRVGSQCLFRMTVIGREGSQCLLRITVVG